jgi:glycosyltransferase involved in cell wall biosynthesis
VRVLLLHNRYQRRGGEDTLFDAVGALLASRGHAVRPLEVTNADIGGAVSPLRAAGCAVWSPAAGRAVAQAVARFRPDVVHVHNFFPLLSPSVHRACRRSGVAVVQTLQNYRLLCPNALLFRDGHPCEECLGRAVPWPGVVHGCYRGSRLATAPVAAMVAVHRALRTWQRAVDVFVAPTEFVRRKFAEGGLDPRRIAVQPNLVEASPEPGDGQGGYALAVGRLSEEKGFDTLVAAWARLGRELPLKIVGDGPLLRALRAAAAEVAPDVEWTGWAPAAEVRRLMRSAMLVVVPSRWYETFGNVIVEAFAAGAPVVAARHGAMAELVQDGRTGLLFEPGNAVELAAAVRWLASSPRELGALRREARAEFEARYGEERYYARLLQIYARAIERARSRRPDAARVRSRAREEQPWTT